MMKSRATRASAAAIAAAAAVAIGYSGYRLFRFGLDPHMRESMIARVISGGVEASDEAVSPADADFEHRAKAWFLGARRSIEHLADDGQRLFGWRIDAACDEQPTHDYAIVCHGYSSAPEHMARYVYHFFERNMSVLAPAARAHERNSDTGFIQMGWRDSLDLLGWIQDICRRDHRARIILFGLSMGAAEVMMASGLELPENVRLIIEDCGYTSVWDEFFFQFKRMFKMPAFPVLYAADAICRLRAGFTLGEASSLERLAHARIPMLFIHGTRDTFVPFSMLDEVFDACASPVKRKLAINGAGHARSASTDPERYWGTIDAFIDDNL
ncbi:hypothetical protein Corgl_1090 [Coriobacterium glomerans PW2]|uniref:AB hydrolase-1 domain-containing protein n=1 Tax=Coriobacterium glomerans (strain ATCC 49209 / DSM 20642 / JCM 10262 / PW2) TaxID=700015 RepID=F2N815_CORGP|nr:alpha/beta hydrolase [Coriobacterium glomerans]AEB07198.1 hypothetical protein Corgl_1090 [Coriobacterium glomerans PW2]